MGGGAKMGNPMSREEWARRGRATRMKTSARPVDVRVAKGIGPNKASGRKGGIGRQGSKRG